MQLAIQSASHQHARLFGNSDCVLPGRVDGGACACENHLHAERSHDVHVKQAPFEQAVVVDGGLGQLVRKLKKHRSVCCCCLCCAFHTYSPLVTCSNEDVAAAARRLFSTWKQRHHKSAAPAPARLAATPGLDKPPAPVPSNQPVFAATPPTVPAPERMSREVTGGIGASTCGEQNATSDALKPLACRRPGDPSRSFWVDWLEAQLSGKQV